MPKLLETLEIAMALSTELEEVYRQQLDNEEDLAEVLILQGNLDRLKQTTNKLEQLTLESLESGDTYNEGGDRRGDGA